MSASHNLPNKPSTFVMLVIKAGRMRVHACGLLRQIRKEDCRRFFGEHVKF